MGKQKKIIAKRLPRTHDDAEKVFLDKYADVFILPELPSSREKIVYCIAPTGENILRDVVSFFDEYLKLCETVSAPPSCLQHLPGFSLFLNHVCNQCCYSCKNNNDIEILNADWIADFISRDDVQRTPEYVSRLRAGLLEIIMEIGTRWTPSMYMKLIISEIQEFIAHHPKCPKRKPIDIEQWNNKQKRSFVNNISQLKLSNSTFLNSYDLQKALTLDDLFLRDLKHMQSMFSDEHTSLARILEYLQSLDTTYPLHNSMFQLTFPLLFPESTPEAASQADVRCFEDVWNTAYTKNPKAHISKDKLRAFTAAIWYLSRHTSGKKINTTQVRREMQHPTAYDSPVHGALSDSEISRLKKALKNGTLVFAHPTHDCRLSENSLKILDNNLDQLHIRKEVR